MKSNVTRAEGALPESGKKRGENELLIGKVAKDGSFFKAPCDVCGSPSTFYLMRKKGKLERKDFLCEAHRRNPFILAERLLEPMRAPSIASPFPNLLSSERLAG